MALAAALLAATPAHAPPPPPASPPPGVNFDVDGYDLRTPYVKWARWVDRQRGPAVEALLAEPDPIPGERQIGDPIIEFRRTGDSGQIVTGEITLFCQGTRSDERLKGCHYRLRRAYVPHYAYGSDNPIRRWVHQSFDPPQLARLLRENGFGPDTDWWMADTDKVFAAMPSPLAVFRANATVVRLDSNDCPRMASAIETLDRQRIDWRVDMFRVGLDTKLVAPAPHTLITTYTVRLQLPGPAGEATITGAGPSLDRLLMPILEAADQCEKAREKAS